MEDKRSIKKVLESQGVQLGVQDHLVFKLTSRLHTTSILRSTYARKSKEIAFPMAPVSCPTKIGVVRNIKNQQSRDVVTARVRTDAIWTLHHQC
jgi:hypothetical protein